MTPIVDDSPISFTCCVCGSPVNPLAKGLSDLLGEFSTKCRKCGKAVCREHFDKKTGACTKCAAKGSDWCGTPDVL